MSLFRSVIADARHPKSVGKFPLGLSAAIGLKTRQLNRDAPESREQPADAPAQATHLSRSLPGERSASESVRYDTPGLVHSDNPIELGIQDSARNSDQARPLSVPEEMHATNPGPEENHSTIPGQESQRTDHAGNAPYLDTPFENIKRVVHRASDSISLTENIEEVSGKNVIVDNANTVYHEKENVRLPEEHESQLSANEDNTPPRGEPSGAIAVDENPCTERSSRSLMDVTADSVGRNESNQGLVDGVQSNHVHSGVDKQANSKLPSNLEDDRQLQRQNLAEVTVGDDQLVSRQSLAKGLHASSGEKPSPILQSAGKQESTQTNSTASVSSHPPGSATPKHSNSVRQTSGILRSSANSESLGSAPARLAQAELIANSSVSFRAGPPVGLAGRKRESPEVQIGQIDVIVAAASQPVGKPAMASSPIDLASRYYLRRL